MANAPNLGKICRSSGLHKTAWLPSETLPMMDRLPDDLSRSRSRRGEGSGDGDHGIALEQACAACLARTAGTWRRPRSPRDCRAGFGKLIEAHHGLRPGDAARNSALAVRPGPRIRTIRRLSRSDFCGGQAQIALRRGRVSI